MNTNFKELIPQNFDDNSRVWIYQANRPFTNHEILEIKDKLAEFAAQWNSHGSKVESFANLFFDRFIILMADESAVRVGGCSTDSSTRFIKTLEGDYEVSLFDRLMLAFIIQEKVESVPLMSVNTEIENGLITGDTLYFNNTILTKKELLTKWIIPVRDSWLASRLPDFVQTPRH